MDNPAETQPKKMLSLNLRGISSAATDALARNTIRGVVEEETAKEAERRKWENVPPGTVMPDGSVYAGTTPAGAKLYAMPQDEDGIMNLEEAKGCARRLNDGKAHGHDDWRVPTREELTVLFNNRARIPNLDLSAIGWPFGGYLSATESKPGEVWARYFHKGNENSIHSKISDTGVRCVRTGPWQPD